MNDPSDTRRLRGLKQDLGVRHGLMVREETVVESHPVGVDQYIDPSQ
jgi:hypothetical protein